MEVRPIDANRLAEEIAHMSEAGHRTWSTKGLLNLLCRQPTLTLPDRETAKACMRLYEQEPMNFPFTKSTALAFIREAAADVVEARHGKWVAEGRESVSKRNRIIEYKVYSCSMCGRSIGRVRKKYCPNCGARMDKED